MKKLSFVFLSLLFIANAFGQDINYARKTIDKLCSPKYNGRGYVNGGDAKASVFIYKELKKLKGFTVQYQPFAIAVNTFPNKMEVTAGGKELEAGTDYIVAPECPSVKGKHKLLWVNYNVLQSQHTYDSFVLANKNTTPVFVVLDTLPQLSKEERERLKDLQSGKQSFVAGLAQLTNGKLTWSVGSVQDAIPQLTIKADKFPRTAQEIEIKIDAVFIERYKTQNVIGFIKGTKQPDSIIALTAHYDHLGRMGKKTYFPGANDNASGTAMLLDMAKHYSKNPPEYSILFIAFAAEEAGLVGSNYYVNADPIYPLDKMKFLINMDLMATGEKGIMAVNGLVFEEEYKNLVKINDDKKYLSTVQARGKAANSDHYWFAEKGVHCFFFYLMGDFPSYHDPGDKAEIVPLTKYEETFRLINDFINHLQQ